jgi:hypothetical protein
MEAQVCCHLFLLLSFHLTSLEKINLQLAEVIRRQIEIEKRDRILPPNHILTRHVRRVVSQLLEANNLGYLRSDANTFDDDDQAQAQSPSKEIWRPDDAASSGRSQVSSGPSREWTVFVVNNDKILNANASMGSVSLKASSFHSRLEVTLFRDNCGIYRHFALVQR